MTKLKSKYDHFEKKIEQIYGTESLEKIREAYAFAERSHEGQFRSSGEPFIVHPLEVGFILIDLGLDIDTIAAGLLHDVVEDTGVKIESWRKNLGQKLPNW